VKRVLLGATTLALAVGLVLLLGGALLGSSTWTGPAEAAGPTPTPGPPPPVPDYKCYDIPGQPLIPPVSVNTETQFDREYGVAVGQATRLCLPAGKNGEPIPDVPHLKCYAITGHDPRYRVNLRTDFGIEADLDVGPPTTLCVPVTKQVVPPTPAATPTPGPLPPSVPHYVCYSIAGAPPAVAPVSLETQFGVEPGVPVMQPVALCAPALKTMVVGAGTPTPTPEGDLNLPHLKCYAIAGPLPERTVNLTSQFGEEMGVVVGPPSLLCVPATKQLSHAVGGVAELPAASGASPLAEESGGLSTGAYAAMAGGAVGTMLILSVGVLYARRRRLK